MVGAHSLHGTITIDYRGIGESHQKKAENCFCSLCSITGTPVLKGTNYPFVDNAVAEKRKTFQIVSFRISVAKVFV